MGNHPHDGSGGGRSRRCGLVTEVVGISGNAGQAREDHLTKGDDHGKRQRHAWCGRRRP